MQQASVQQTIAYIGPLPRLWIRRLAVFEQVEPLSLLREVTFTRGLNIITGEDKDGTALGGHSVGKTSLCRVLRYGLGEGRFATKQQEEAVRQEFPNGWMALELFINGEAWCAARPLNRMTGQSRAMRSESAEMLFSPDFSENEYLSYQKTLASLTPPSTDISWGELLPWLTRDQECSFGDLTAWRSAESESDSPRPPKKEASQIIRSVLGLFRQNEVEIAERVQQLKKGLKAAQERVDEAIQIPVLECGIIASRLYANLGLPHTKHQPSPMEVDMAISSKQEELDEQIQRQESVVDSFLEELARFKVMLESHQNQYDLLSGKIAPKQRMVQDNKLGDRNERYRTLKTMDKCEYISKPLSKCQAYQDHLSWLERRIAQPTAQDFQNQAEYKRHLVELEELEKTVSEQGRIVAQLSKDIEDIKGDIKKARVQLGPLYRKKELREQMLEDFKTYHAKASSPANNPDLSEAQHHQEKIQVELEESNSQLKEIYKQKDASHKGIEEFYGALAKAMLGSVANGKVSSKADLVFSISGAGLQEKTAVKALSTIIADIMAMLSTAEGLTSHPGFMVHDGLRTHELADLFFYKLLNTLVDETNRRGGTDFAPFQYIVTTMSPLNEKLSPFVRKELSENNLFWTRRLAGSFQQGELLASE